MSKKNRPAFAPQQPKATQAPPPKPPETLKPSEGAPPVTDGGQKPAESPQQLTGDAGQPTASDRPPETSEGGDDRPGGFEIDAAIVERMAKQGDSFDVGQLDGFLEKTSQGARPATAPPVETNPPVVETKRQVRETKPAIAGALKRFRVEIKHVPPMIGVAASPEAAVAAYKAANGIIQTDHQPLVEELSDADGAGATDGGKDEGSGADRGPGDES